MAGCPSALERRLVILDEVLHTAASAIGSFVQKRRLGAFKTCDDESDVVAPVIDFRHDDHSERPMP